MDVFIYHLYDWSIREAAAFRVQMAWGISKFLLTIVILPLILIGMVVGGLLYIAFPILIVIGIITLFCR